jgi:putative transposase
MMLSVSDIAGLPGVPDSKFGVHKWLKRLAIRLFEDGNRFIFAPSDLPAPLRAAFLDREAEEYGLDPGDYDEAAHARLEEATPRMRARAEADAQVVWFIKARVQAGLSQEDAFKAARAKFGAKGTSRATLLRNMKAVKGVDPVNFAPALLADHSREGGPKGPRAKMSPEAWAYHYFRLQHARWCRACMVPVSDTSREVKPVIRAGNAKAMNLRV